MQTARRTVMITAHVFFRASQLARESKHRSVRANFFCVFCGGRFWDTSGAQYARPGRAIGAADTLAQSPW